MEKQEEVKFTREWFVEQGKLGGEKLKRLYGEKYFTQTLPQIREKKRVDKLKKMQKKPIKQAS